MDFSTVLRAVLRRWYITVPAALLSLIVAITVFNSMPPKYTSSGIAVLVRQNNPTPANFVNPVLGVDGSLTTTTLTLMQALDTPAVKAELGLREGADNFTVKNKAEVSEHSWGDNPFLYIETQSSDPQKSAEIVVAVMDSARQKLAELQNDYHVRSQNQIKLQSVVDATPPKVVRKISFAVGAAVLMLGLVVTCLVACAWDRIIIARQKRRVHRSKLHAIETAIPRPRANDLTSMP
jgi:capsular polysaccharide biosynthesis protein